jgi:hypothetical protein
MGTKIATFSDRFEQMVSSTAEAWQSHANRLAMGGLYPPFYLYYREGTATEDGGMLLAPEGTELDSLWHLGDTEAYRSNLTYARTRQRIHAASRRLPILSSGF